MFTADYYIDTVQNGKKTFVNTFVQHDAIKTALNEFIDAQTEYTKQATKVVLDSSTKIASESVKALQEASKFDYAKFGEGIMKAYNNTTKTK